MDDVNILNVVLQTFLNKISEAYGNTLPVANYFLYCFMLIEFVRFGLSYAFGKSSYLLADLLVKIFKITLILWAVDNLPYLHETLRDSAVALGVKATNSFATIDLILNPSKIARYGVDLSKIILAQIGEFSILHETAHIILGLLATLIIMGSFFYLALQMFMALLDFYFSSAIAAVFLAFRVFGPTAWIGAGAIRGPIQHAVKLFTMSFIICLAEPCIESLMKTGEEIKTDKMWALVLLSIVFMMLSIRAGSWAAGLFSGGPTAGASDLAAGAGIVTGAVAGGTVGSVMATKGAGKVAGATASGATTVGAAAVTGAQLAGIGYGGSSAAGRLGAMGAGAARGAAGAAMAPAKAVQERVGKLFKEATDRGRRQGYISTGGKLSSSQAQGSQSSDSKSSRLKAGYDAVKKAQQLQKIADAFKDQQNPNEH